MTTAPLFHFSEAGDIAVFTPRQVTVPAARPPGMAWLNGPLVWAVDDWRQPMYLFPRDCPRILIWPTEETTDADRDRYWERGEARMLAYVEQRWLDRLKRATIFRYVLPRESFTYVEAGMWVSRESVTPAQVATLSDLPRRLAELDVELRSVPDLRTLKPLWGTSLHVSGIRLRNASQGWP